MPILNEQVLGTTVISMIVVYVFSFIFQVYMLYLNWKQSKVKNTTEELVNIMKEIRDLLKTKEEK